MDGGTSTATSTSKCVHVTKVSLFGFLQINTNNDVLDQGVQ